ncbi:MAG: glycosyltransferase [Xanthomonadales bacterium PRO7]|nr:glycosyltransferase [Xanthomonadales bacterium PRO7]
MSEIVDVSVCITTFNQKAYIARCLDSAVSQLPGKCLEVLVGDDGSDDGTRDIVKSYAARYPERIVPVFHEQNLGPSGNYRALIGRSRGRYVAHLDGDDYWLPGKLARQIEILEQSRANPAVVGNAFVIDSRGVPLGLFTSNTNEAIDLDFLLERGNFLCHGSLVYRAEFKERILTIPGNFVDYMILIRLAAVAPLAYVPEPLVVYLWNSPISMRATMTPLVGENYWEAMLEALRLGASPRAFRRCTVRFLERIASNSVAQLRMRPCVDWIARVRKESPVPVGAAVLTGLVRTPLALGRLLRRRIGGRLFPRICVFYPR